MNRAQEMWNSWFSDELKNIWNCKPPELRKTAMLSYILDQELQRVQNNLSLQLQEFMSYAEYQISSIKQFQLQQRRDEGVTAVLAEKERSRSPKINKTRNISFKRRIPNLRLNLSKENLRRTEDLDVEIVKSSPEVKTPTEDEDMLKSSLVIPTTPDFSFSKKPNRKISKRSQNDKSTSIFRFLPTSTSTKSSDQMSPKFEKIDKILKDVNSDDDTFCDLKMETSNVSKKEVKTTSFKDDKFLLAGPKSRLYAHKTAPARREADRMQLPGWSCDYCEKFFGRFNLPPEVKLEKMNACLRHGSKFDPVNKTFPE